MDGGELDVGGGGGGAAEKGTDKERMTTSFPLYRCVCE
jgi:hypothetical protein